jgi:chemotaxis signal transduction protein
MTLPPATEMPRSTDIDDELAALAATGGAAEEAGREQAALHARFFVFRAGDRWLGVEPSSVREVAPAGALTRIPETPACFCGITPLRGGVVAVVAIDAILGGGQDAGAPARFVIMEEAARRLAVPVTEVAGVVELPLPRRSGDTPSSAGVVLAPWGQLVNVVDVKGLFEEVVAAVTGYRGR